MSDFSIRVAHDPFVFHIKKFKFFSWFIFVLYLAFQYIQRNFHNVALPLS